MSFLNEQSKCLCTKRLRKKYTYWQFYCQYYWPLISAPHILLFKDVSVHCGLSARRLQFLTTDISATHIDTSYWPLFLGPHTYLNSHICISPTCTMYCVKNFLVPSVLRRLSCVYSSVSSFNPSATAAILATSGSAHKASFLSS